MKVMCMLSNRHIHLTQETQNELFGGDVVARTRFLFGSSGPYATNQVVTLVGPRNQIEHVRLLGPCRSYNQVELLKADCVKLGVDAPIRMSGKLDGAAPLKIVGPLGEIEIPCGIIAHRHIHVGGLLAKEEGLSDGQIVQVRKGGIRGITFENVIITIKNPQGTTALMHVDIEEGNAAMIENGDVLDVLV